MPLLDALEHVPRRIHQPQGANIPRQGAAERLEDCWSCIRKSRRRRQAARHRMLGMQIALRSFRFTQIPHVPRQKRGAAGVDSRNGQGGGKLVTIGAPSAKKEYLLLW